MNKQDKIKKVMREFKDGKLKTPNGEVVTDKKQALAIAMSESEDYAEKADLIEDISISSLSHAEDVIKSIGSEELFEKAVYADTAENRKLGRVGQEYHRGKGKKEKKKADKKSSGSKNSWGYEIKPEYSNNMSKVISKKFGKYLDGEDDSMEFIDSYWKSVANGADEKALQNSLKHAIHDRVSPGSKDADDAFKEAMANIKHYEKESQNLYKIKPNTEVKKAIDDEMGISDAYRELFGEDLEKAHQDGDMHPNGKWVWVSSANGGKGDWRTLNGRAHKKHADTQASNKFLENFKNASDDVLNKIVSGKIQAVDRERKLAQQILDSRKKSVTQSQPQSKEDKVINPSSSKKYHMTTGQLNELLGRAETKVENGEKKYLVSYKAIGKDRGSSWQTKSQIESYLRGWDDAQVSLPDKKKKSIKSGSNGTSKTEKPGQQSAKMKVDDTTIDQAEYDKAYKTATSATETEEHLKSSLDEIKANINEIKGALANSTYVFTAYKLQKMLTDSVSKKKAIEDALKTKNAHVQKLIDTYKISNNSYTDISKMSIVITPKGNWNLRYDGKDVSTISGQRNIMDRKTLEAAGIKFEDSKKRPVGAGTNGPTPKIKADKTASKQHSSFVTKTINKLKRGIEI